MTPLSRTPGMEKTGALAIKNIAYLLDAFHRAILLD
jgi:hypothetical protein